MSDFWTYSLSDFLPFSRDTWLRLFELYNTAISPLPLLFTLLGLGLLWHLTRQPVQRHLITLGLVLSVAWIWVGWQFLWLRYAQLNWAAQYMAIGFFLQSALLLLLCVFSKTVRWQATRDHYNPVAVLLGLFALVLYPLSGLLLGRTWYELDSVGATPDPTVLFTLALLLLTRGVGRWLLLPMPLLWCVLSSATALAMDSLEAWLLAPPAFIVLLLMLHQQWFDWNRSMKMNQLH